MRTGKICILLDPDKPQVSNVFNACIRLKEIFDKRFLNKFVEYWVGGTNSSGYDVRKWLKRLKDEGLGQRLIYPGKITHLLGYKYTNTILVPNLLNWTNFGTYLHCLLGISLAKFYERKQLFGYLVMSNGSSVGRLIGAKNLSNKEALEIVKKFLNRNESRVVYLEAGSGSKKPVDIKLVERVSKIMGNYSSGSLIVGGGIRNAGEVKKLFAAGVDKVVVGTVLEQDGMEKSLAVMKSLIRPFET